MKKQDFEIFRTKKVKIIYKFSTYVQFNPEIQWPIIHRIDVIHKVRCREIAVQ